MTILDSDTLTYSIFGNILSKTGVGAYTYGSTKPYAVKSVTNPDGLIGTPQSVTYNGGGKVNGVTEEDYVLNIEYGTEDDRWRSSLYEDGSLIRSVRFGDGYDFVTIGDTLRRIYYLDENVILVEIPLTGESKLYYALTDRLGSYTDIMDCMGERVFLAEYDEWGRQEVTKNEIGFIRGYTGHEMLPEFGLINMNGRMYDPMLARFLSPDDYVQLPTSPQGYNRYSYCMNNPLRYTDPSGEVFGIGHIISAVCGFVSGYLSNAITTGDWGWDSVKSGLLGAAASAISYNILSANSSAYSLWGHVAKNAANDFIGKAMPSQTFNLGEHFSITMTPTFGFGDGGLTGGFGIMASYHNHNLGIGLGLNATNHYF